MVTAMQKIRYESIPDTAGGIAILKYGDFLYTAGEEGFIVYDLKDPANPRKLRTMTGFGLCRQMAVSNGILYLTARHFGLWILSLKDPASPKVINRFDTVELATGLAVHENYVFIAERIYGIEMIDCTDPLHPRHISLIRSDEAQSVVFHRGKLYAGEWGSCKLSVFDYSNFHVPKLLGQYPLGGKGDGVAIQNNVYETYSIFPATGRFSFKSEFLSRMGFDTIYDGEKLKKMLTYELEHYPFKGVDDGTLFELSKPIVSDIIKSKKPYFLFMETINTHCKGYFTKACRDMGFPQNNMEDIARCEDKLVYDFVLWFMKQDPKAVVILLDDHNQEHGSIAKKLEDISDRPLSNVFINTKVFRGTDVNRPVSAMDMFPTIVEAAGGVIDGCRLGLGTSLSKRCEKVQTLREMFSPDELTQKMEQSNNFYYELATGVKR